MFDTTDIRRTCQNILDGMSFNREKFARTSLDLCKHVESQDSALVAERNKNKALTAEVETLKLQLAQAKAAANSGFPGGLGDAFGNAFGDIFTPTGQYRKP
jgi:BMFP domain-containing protein YqiC